MNAKRLLELIARKSILEGILEVKEKESNDKILMLLAKTFDKDIAETTAVGISVLKTWINEIQTEIITLSEQVIEECFEPEVESYLVNIKGLAKDKAKELVKSWEKQFEEEKKDNLESKE